MTAKINSPKGNYASPKDVDTPSDKRLRLAQRIIDRLFTNGFPQKAFYIAMKDVNEKDLGGWSYKAAVDEAVDAIREHDEIERGAQ